MMFHGIYAARKAGMSALAVGVIVVLTGAVMFGVMILIEMAAH